MTDAELIQTGRDLQIMQQDSAGWKRVKESIETEMDFLFQSFMVLPPDVKTTNRIIEVQAEYRALKRLLEWVNESISKGREAEVAQARRQEKAATTPSGSVWDTLRAQFPSMGASR